MHDTSISISQLVTGALWAWVALLFAGAWAAWAMTDSDDVWMMLAFTGCASSALAATSQIRCYSLRICGLLRVTTGLDESARPVDLHRLR